jgi:hypothetical protein
VPLRVVEGAAAAVVAVVAVVVVVGEVAYRRRKKARWRIGEGGGTRKAECRRERASEAGVRDRKEEGKGVPCAVRR